MFRNLMKLQPQISKALVDGSKTAGGNCAESRAVQEKEVGEGTSHEDGGEATTKKNEKKMKMSDDIGYASDTSFEDYYLFYEQERELMNFISPVLHSACEAHRLSWDDPIPMMDELKRKISTKENWKNLPMHDKYLKDMIEFMRRTGLKKKAAAEAISSSSSSSPQQNKGLTENTQLDIQIICSWLSSSDDNSTETLVHSSPIRGDALAENDVEQDNIMIPAPAVPILIIRRLLKKSDMAHHQQRLSMPCSQILQESTFFLTAEEAEQMERGVHIPIRIIDPSNRTYSAHLRKTRSGPRTYSYAIGKPWNDIKRDNRFIEGMAINVWAVRNAENELVLRLERVEG